MSDLYSGKSFALTEDGKVIARSGGHEASNPKIKAQSKKRASKLRRKRAAITRADGGGA